MMDAPDIEEDFAIAEEGPAIERLGDDAGFLHDIDRIIKDGEEMRVNYMRQYRNRGFIATTIGLIALCAGAGAFGWFLIMNGDVVKALACMILAVVFPVMLYLWHDNPVKAYQEKYKTVVMPKIAKTLGGLKFHPEKGVSANVLGKTGIVPKHEIYETEDCFIGRYKNTKVVFSEAKLRMQGDEDYVFKGVFAFLELASPNFKGHTIITSDDKMVHDWAGSRWKKLSPVHLPEDSEYNDLFKAFSDHPEQAKQVLTADLLKELAEAGKVFDDASISAAMFKGKYVFITIPSRRNMFEASNIFVPVTTREHAMNCKREIERILEIVDIFDLYQP